MSNEMHVNGEITILFAENGQRSSNILYMCSFFFHKKTGMQAFPRRNHFTQQLCFALWPASFFAPLLLFRRIRCKSKCIATWEIDYLQFHFNRVRFDKWTWNSNGWRFFFLSSLRGSTFVVITENFRKLFRIIFSFVSENKRFCLR